MAEALIELPIGANERDAKALGEREVQRVVQRTAVLVDQRTGREDQAIIIDGLDPQG